MMLPNGKASSNAEVASSVATAVKAQLAKAETGKTDGLPSGPQNFDTKLVTTGIECVLQSAREGANLTRKVFNLIRACATVAIAKGTMTVAENQAIEKASKGAVAVGQPAITTLAGLAEANGMNSLSYVQIKSNLFKGHEKAKEYADIVQRLYNYKERLEKAPRMVVQTGWCDIFSDRYADPKEGSTMYMRDVRFSLKAIKDVDRYAKQLQREAAARAEGAAITNANAGAAPEATNGVTVGIRSGDGNNGEDVVPEELQGRLNQITLAIGDSIGLVSSETVASILEDCIIAIREQIARAKAGPLDSENQAEGLATAENSEDTTSVPTIDDHTLTDLTRPEWYSTEEWRGFTQEQRNDILDDPEADKESAQYIAWSALQPLSEDEEASIKEHGESLKDAAG